MDVAWPDWAVVAASEGKIIITRITTDDAGRVTSAEFEIEEPESDDAT